MMMQLMGKFGGKAQAKGGESWKGGFDKGGESGKSAGKGKKSSPHSEYPASQKVWVGNFPAGTTKEDLKTHFTLLGEPKFVGMGATTACIVFGTDFEATSAVEVMNGSELGGSALQVDVWTKRSD